MIDLPVIPSSVRTHDNTMMSSLDCLCWYDIRHNQGLIPAGEEKAATAFGSLLHSALAVWYKTWNPNKVLKTLRQADFNDPDGDHRTRGRAITTMFKYMEHYGESDIFDKILLTETSFDVEDPEDGFRWGGVIDLVVVWQGKVWVVDHKSTVVGTTRWWSDFEMSPQMAGYVYAGGLLAGQPIAGVIINRLTIQTKDKSAEEEFSRRSFLYQPWKIAEWKQQQIEKYHIVKRAQETGEWPRNWHACHGRWGLCGAHTYCNTHAKRRERVLASDFVRDPWDWNREAV